MQYARLGDTGLVVSRLGFGAMTFGQTEMVPGVRNEVGQPLAEEMVGRCLDAGITLFDTADAYLAGETERMLGQALGDRRRDVVISTKVGFRTGAALTDAGLSYRHVVMSAEASLKRLGTDWIDLYQLHIPDAVTPVEETLRALEDLVRAGKVRYVGLSNFPAWRTAEMRGIQAARRWAPLRAAQMYYSLLGRDLELECVPYYRAAGIGVLSWSPLASGFLSGKYDRASPPEEGRRKAFAFPPIDVEKGYAVVELLRGIAARHGATPAQVAITWILTRDFITTVLLGARTMDQLEDNLCAAGLTLSAEEIDRLDELTRPAALYPGYMLDMMGLDPKVKAKLEG
jgi:aryl-alcohol dehydrogenase-like predicted oxidoreductase